MKKMQKLKVCNWVLLIMIIPVLVSGIELEATSGSNYASVRCHIVIASIFLLLTVWHISLNLSWSGWFKKFSRLKSPVTRILWWLFLLTALSGIAAEIHWLATYAHSPVGAIHGKIGFAMLIVAIGHTLKRLRFFAFRRPLNRR